jgi:hypothetical protein
VSARTRYKDKIEKSDNPKARSKETIMESERHSFIAINPDDVQTVFIEVNRGTIWATPNGGSLRVRAGKEVCWECAEKFSLSFRPLGGSALPWRSPEVTETAGVWRARGEPPPFRGRAPFYEYIIQVGDLTLDPIVIVDD